MACCSPNETCPPSSHHPADRATRLQVEGMTCGNCARQVTEALQTVPGVTDVSVQLDNGRAVVTWQSDMVPHPEAVTTAVKQAGFRAQVLDPASDEGASSRSQLATWRFNVVLGAFLTLPLMIGEWFLRLGETPGFQWIGFAFATPVLVVCGRHFFVGAWRQLRRGASNMDTLVSLGSSTAYLYSTVGLLLGWQGHLYFMEAAAIITLISTGHWLEALASSRAAGTLRALMQLAPSTAQKQQADGSELEVPVASLQPGDVVSLRPGDHIPTDGIVETGESTVNESMLTGESMPVEKGAGARVYAGTLNQEGRLVMQVTALGEATALARIISVVQRAQNSRAKIQRLADRVSNVFVPVVVLVALLTALLWGLAPEWARVLSAGLQPFLWPAHLPESALAAAIVHATAVLIVACPCAMGLATPAAIMAGANAAARHGILIRDGQALEKSGSLTAVAFDKTGTLTRGQVTVTETVSFLTEDRGFSLPAASLALSRSSQHPVSRAVAEWSERELEQASSLSVYAWQEHRGQGVQAAWSGSTLRLGSIHWLRSCGVDLAYGEAFLTECTNAGATVVGLAQDRMLLGLFAVRDELKPHAAQVVETLRRRGLKVFMVTGDQRSTAVAIARAAGFPEAGVFAEVRPEEKALKIEALQRRGERVAFVGDGINDAPALEQADLGIAVARASDIARESADLVLINSDIHAIPEAIALAQATLRTIRQNLFWAFFYNAAAIPLAALGYLSPVICALAMGLSDLVVIGNALRLGVRR